MAESVPGGIDTESTDRNPVVRGLLTIRGSFLFSIMAIGVVLVLVGLLLQFGLNEGTLAAMTVIWGTSAILYGLLGVVFLRVIGYK